MSFLGDDPLPDQPHVVSRNHCLSLYNSLTTCGRRGRQGRLPVNLECEDRTPKGPRCCVTRERGGPGFKKEGPLCVG